ncbi:MAG: hypothetical protein ACRDIB_06110, partial [Ardenticatenaceae bacterium]
YRVLAAEGVLIIADLVAPATPLGEAVAAEAWEEAVRERSLQRDGDLRAFEQFQSERWNLYRYFDPHDIDHPSPLYDQLRWLEAAGFVAIDVYWMQAGHAIFGGRRADQKSEPGKRRVAK